MTVNISKGQLLQWSREIQQMSQSIMGAFFAGKIREFLNLNQLRIDGIKSGMKDIEKKYFIYENNEPKMTDGNPVLIEGKLVEDFKKESTEFLAQAITVTI